MKIATWNVEQVRPGQSPKATTVRDALQHASPDVVVLTESHPGFEPSGGYNLVSVSTEAPDRRNGQRWVCIWVGRTCTAGSLGIETAPERSAAAWIQTPAGYRIIIFGTVLPWRTDKRHATMRGAAAFVNQLEAQSTDVSRLRAAYPDDAFCFIGDLNQEVDADGPVGTRAGRAALGAFLGAHDLEIVTGGQRDPLASRGWRKNIDHIAMSRNLSARCGPAVIWPEEYPLTSRWPDHHGVAVTLTLK